MTSEAATIDNIAELQKHIPADFYGWKADVHHEKAKIRLVVNFPGAYAQQVRLRNLLTANRIPFNFHEGFFSALSNLNGTYRNSYSGQFSNCQYTIHLKKVHNEEDGYVTLVANKKGGDIQPLLTLLDIIKEYTTTA